MVFEKSPVSDAPQAEPDVEPDDAKVNEAMANLSARPGMFQRLPSGHDVDVDARRTCPRPPRRIWTNTWWTKPRRSSIAPRRRVCYCSSGAVRVAPHRDGMRLIDTADTGAW